MILEQIYKKPFISFEFNQVEKTVLVGETVNIWSSIGSNVTIDGIKKINTNQFEIFCNSTGIFTYTGIIGDKESELNLIESNEIKITVI